MGWIAQPLGTWTVFSAEGELCAGELVAAWEVGIPGMQRFNGRCSKGATVVCTNVERERDEQIMVSLCLRGHAMLRRTRRALPRSDHAGRRRQPSAKGFVQSPSTSSSTTHPRPSTHLLLLVYSCCYLPNTLHIIRIASLLRQRCALLLHPLFQNPCCFNLRFPLSTLRGVETAAKLKQTTLLLWTGRSLLEHASPFCLSCLFSRYPYLPA